MIPSVFDKRPPFVRFEEREFGIDAIASDKAGRPIPRVVVMACITPAGSKDVVEKIAEEWLDQIKGKALRGEYPLEWSNFFRAQFDEWKKGNELPREGTPVKTWAMITQEQSRRLIAVGYTTVEDLAQVPDSALGQIGLDGRYLRDLARGWIQEAEDKGVNARRIAEQQVQIDELERANGEMLAQIKTLRAELGEPRRGPGRPRKEQPAEG